MISCRQQMINDRQQQGRQSKDVWGRSMTESGRDIIDKGPDGWTTGPMKRNEIWTYNFSISDLARSERRGYRVVSWLSQQFLETYFGYNYWSVCMESAKTMAGNIFGRLSADACHIKININWNNMDSTCTFTLKLHFVFVISSLTRTLHHTITHKKVRHWWSFAPQQCQPVRCCVRHLTTLNKGPLSWPRGPMKANTILWLIYSISKLLF
jgi:hypothetical protein